MSLRGRLLLATLILVALGLVAANAATYGLLRSQLVGRVDEQLKAASGFAGQTQFDTEDRRHGSGSGGYYGGVPGKAKPPPGQLVEQLDASGDVSSRSRPVFGSTQAEPVLPAGLPGSTAAPNAPDRILTTSSTDESVRYRVLAAALPEGGTLVVAIPLDDVEAALSKLVLVEAIVSLAVLAGVAALALWLVRLGLRPLTRMEQTAAHIAEGDLSRRVDPSDGRTEVGRLGRALNGMLSKIEAAFAERRASEERLRRFVADASHELRTPLTSIRGYAELFRRGADVRPEDLAKSMRRIEEESTRMSELVEELLLLARLDQGRPLEVAPLDLTKVAVDAVEDARAVQPGRSIRIEKDGPVLIDGDDARLRQVAANLLSNALIHTPQSAEVRVRVGPDGDRAVLEVADDGPGLSGEQAAKVFDRFFRVDKARSRETGNVGLGLSIVSAIVHAHGGTVELDTAPGRGARFLVTLPRAISG